MRKRKLTARAQHASISGLLIMWLVCLPVAWFAVQLFQDVPLRAARNIAAAFDWYGERGSVTISESQKVRTGGGRGGSRQETHCFGDFVPDDGSTPLPHVRVHVGDCDEGRVVTARLVRKDLSSWVMPHDKDEAFAGHGWGTPLVLLLFMGTFLLIAGGPFVLCAVLFPVMMLQALVVRLRSSARRQER